MLFSYLAPDIDDAFIACIEEAPVVGARRSADCARCIAANGSKSDPAVQEEILQEAMYYR